MVNYYESAPDSAFWKRAVVATSPFALADVYKKKFDIKPNWQIATAGSCFAQHIARHLNCSGYRVIDFEPPPVDVPLDVARRFGYRMYSARYGNIYTTQQLLQLALECTGKTPAGDLVWGRDGRFFDALRQSIEPDGLDSMLEVETHRRWHLRQVRRVFLEADVFIFTLGLTEAWCNREGTVFSSAPGVIADPPGSGNYFCKTYSFYEIINSFNSFQKTLQTIRSGKQLPRIILTVSPVPLTATASGQHVLQANTRSKSLLRSVAAHLSETQSHIDYFPSYEIITNPSSRGMFFSENLRSVRPEGVSVVMKVFESAHPNLSDTESTLSRRTKTEEAALEPSCEEALAEVFAK